MNSNKIGASTLKRTALAVGILVATGQAAFAELALEEVLVTATPGGKSKMDSSVSVSTVSEERVQQSVARTTTEIFRTIPGIRSESSAGESNTNLSVRGIPVASGGGKFLQLHEDGLPVLQYGDVIVGNADNYITYDRTVDRVEVVKGGTAATMASNSPAGVINFVGKSGREEGGVVVFTTGLDYDSTRMDFAYGAPINDEWSFHVGGFYRQGEGVRETGFNGNEGGQLKLSLTRDFENGSARVYAKVLDDKTTTYLPMPMEADGSSISGMDALTSSNIPRGLSRVRTGDGGTSVRNSSATDGSRVESTVIGGEFEIEISEDLTLREKFRLAKNSGKFFGVFTAAIGDATIPDAISSAFNGQGVDGLAYATGAGAGTVMSQAQLANLNGNGLIQNLRTFDNDINSLDNFSNDLSITKRIDNTEVTLGYYTASQDIDINWYWQTYLADVSDDPRLLDAYSGGNQLTTGGHIAFGAPDWGFCCYRDTALETNLDAYYIAVSSDVSEDLTVSASVRRDSGEGVGHYAFGANNSVDFDGDGNISLAESNAQTISAAAIAGSQYEYDWGYTSYAVGVNYLLDDESAVFANLSKGGRANADRLGDGGFIQNGTVVDGAVENEVTQYEVGYKFEGAKYGIFATLFRAVTEDVNSEGTNGSGTVARVREYESNGLELEATASFGELSLWSSMTYTDAEITDSNTPALEGNKPRRQADFVYSASAVYQFNDTMQGGLTLIGTSDSYAQDANNYELDGYQYLNGFWRYQIGTGLSAVLSVNNLTDEIGITEAEEDMPSTINGAEYVRARSISGRSTSLAVEYEF